MEQPRSEASALSAGTSGASLARVFTHPAGRLDEDRRLIESIRVVLAIVSGLLLLDTPAEAQNRLYFGIIGFSSYAGILLWLSAHRLPAPFPRSLHWIDACWFLLLIGLSAESGIRYFLFLYFPVLFASWRQGVVESILMAVICSLAALAELSLVAPSLSWGRLIALPLSLLLMGPLVAMLARTEANTRQALAFGAELVEGIDARRGLEAIMPGLIERLAREFGAKGALLVMHSFDNGTRVLCWEEGEDCSMLSDTAAQPLIARAEVFPARLAFAYSAGRHRWQRAYLEFLGMTAELGPKCAENIAGLAELLEHGCLMSVPVVSRSIGSVRLLLIGEAGSLRIHDLDMLSHVVEQLGPSVENAILLERLASEAVDNERARIGRNLHDSAIQPYIGLKFAVEALVREAGPDNPLTDDLKRLLEMTTEELASMRDVISSLRGQQSGGGALLLGAVQRQAARFGQLFGMDVQVSIDGALPVNRHLAGELFHIVAEGLSNIRRHTRANRAWISLISQEGLLVLKIRNEHGGQPVPGPFTPRSLFERASSLDGSTRVETDTNGTTIVVTIPLTGALP